MKKLKFVGLLIAAGFLAHSAYATNCPSAVPPATKPPGDRECIGMGTTNVKAMYVYQCQSSGVWQNTGVKCSCPPASNPNETGGTDLGQNNGNLYCMNGYVTSQTKANMSYASN